MPQRSACTGVVSTLVGLGGAPSAFGPGRGTSPACSSFLAAGVGSHAHAAVGNLSSSLLEPNPGPPSGPSSGPLSHQEWLLGELSNDPGRDQWQVLWTAISSAPDGVEPGSPRGFILRCLICNSEFYARSMQRVWQHRCPTGTYDAADGDGTPGDEFGVSDTLLSYEDDHPSTGRGDDLLSDGMWR